MKENIVFSMIFCENVVSFLKVFGMENILSKKLLIGVAMIILEWDKIKL